MGSSIPRGRPKLRLVQRLRWLIEELRVSLWAQQLGTRERVSEARLVREIEAASRP